MELRSAYSAFAGKFTPVALEFTGGPCGDVFAQKNNKTVAQTLDHYRYSGLRSETTRRYSKYLKTPLGTFLMGLKTRGDSFYTRFLNRYGDLKYCEFRVIDSSCLEIMGIYAYFVREDLKYLGRCRDSMKKRVNQGYGKIHPKNCYLDGQATNCRLNAKIEQAKRDVTLWLCPMESMSEIESEERNLIRTFDPPWNVQRG